MTEMVGEMEHANLLGIYAYLDVAPLSLREERFLLLHIRGMSIRAAEREVGFSKGMGNRVLGLEHIDQIIDHLKQQLYSDARIDIEHITAMILEAHRKSASATEELTAARDLAKLHCVGGFAPTPVLQRQIELDKREEQVVKEVKTPKSARALEQMDDEKLLEIADLGGMGSLDPETEESLDPVRTLDEEEAIEGIVLDE